MPPLGAVLRRIPLTIGLITTIVALSVITRTLWDPLATRPLADVATYGLPAFEQGERPFASAPVRRLR